MHSTSSDLLQALHEAGVSYIFANLGSDHTAIIEAMARFSKENKNFPKVILCPHEFVALSAAQGYTQTTGEAQAVFVHLDVGTQNLGGAVHNVSRNRIPVFIFAGDTPFTLEGELSGTRNIPVNYLQDIADQRSIVRPYVKWEYELKTGKNVQQIVYRALQIANSAPQGPVYLMGAREILEEQVETPQIPFQGWAPISPQALESTLLDQMMEQLIAAKNPLIITSYLGRNNEAVNELVKLSETLTIPVVEANPSNMNFPADSVLHQGYLADPLIPEADFILVIDADVPWIISKCNPKEDAKVYYIDVDPLKEKMPMWYIKSEKFIQADSYVALKQMNQYVKNCTLEKDKNVDRLRKLTERHTRLRNAWKEEGRGRNDVITPEFLSQCLNEAIDEDTIILNEAVTNTPNVLKHVPRTKPGTYFTFGGSALGWNGGAAVGMKLAHPDKTVINLTGDGTYLLSVPSSVYWMAKRYKAPIMTVIYNNFGWNATKQNLLTIHPDGYAKQNDSYWVNFNEPADLGKIAEASGDACVDTVHDPSKLKEALSKGIEEVANGRNVVINVIMAPVSKQKDS